VLGVLGLTRAEQDLYEQLVGCPPLTIEELDDLVEEGAAEPLLERLHTLGLVAAQGARWSATPPNAALQVLLSDRARALAQARRYVVELTSRFSQGDTELPAMVEVIYGREEIIRRFQELQLASRHQFRACDAPPYPADDAAVVNAMEVDQLRKGLRFRILYDRRALDIPGRLADLDAGVAAGEQARVADVPVKMTIFDDTAAILPLRSPPDVESRLVVYHPVLLDALSTLFEMYWDRGLPLHAGAGTGEPSAAERHLLVLLVGGLTDQEIAAQLGISDRTVRSRVRAMMARLDAATRFQAGFQAVLRGWIADVQP
jgi:DNA-binding CsgD family transcriptional regulator